MVPDTAHVRSGNASPPLLVPARMAAIAIQPRASIAAAAVLLLIALAPWHRAEHALSVGPVVSIWDTDANDDIQSPLVLGPLTIEIPRAAAAVPNLFDGSGHPDMRPWPAGMVIGPQLSGDRNVLRQLGVWDSLLSALLAPFASISA